MTMIDTPNMPDLDRLHRQLGRRSIVFVGLMGAGKTVIGRRVAEMLGLSFVDSDHEIEDVSRMSVPELFSSYGEGEFRALERRVIARLLKAGPHVVSTGGGAFVNEKTRRAVARDGVSIWLKADLPTLMERVTRRPTRPLLHSGNPQEIMERLMFERYPLYAEAHITVHSRDAAKEIIAAEAIAALGQYLEEEAGGRGPEQGEGA